MERVREEKRDGLLYPVAVSVPVSTYDPKYSSKSSCSSAI